MCQTHLGRGQGYRGAVQRQATAIRWGGWTVPLVVFAGWFGLELLDIGRVYPLLWQDWASYAASQNFVRSAPAVSFPVGELPGLLHPAGTQLPAKRHLTATLDDASSLTITVQGWGFLALLSTAEEAAFAPYQHRGVSPLDPRFTREHLAQLLATSKEYRRKPIKSFLVHDPNVGGIGNGMLQDILYRAQIHPRQRVCDLTADEIDRLHGALRETMELAVAQGGRDSERDLHGQPGGYRPLMDRRAVDQPCPRCGTPIVKVSLLGGSCYYWPACQPDPRG